MNTIYIHAGSAHLDEIFAVAILWLLRPDMIGCKVVRVQSVPDDIEDGDWVLDVGGEFDPARHRYDHHQPGAPEGLCAAGLLCRDLSPAFYGFLTQDPYQGTPSWFRVLNYVDTKGPFAFKKEFGALTSDAFGPALTRMLESGNALEQFAALHMTYEVMLQWRKRHEESLQIDEEAKALQLEYSMAHFTTGNKVTAVLVPSSDPRHAAARARMEQWGEIQPAIQIGFDDRGDGMYILRRGDHHAVNLSSLDGHPAVEFAHKGGFIAKTKTRMTLDEVMELIRPCVDRME